MRLIEKRRRISSGYIHVFPVLLALLALLTLSGLSHTAGAEEKSEASYTSLAELEHQRIGVLTGTVQAIQAQERLPEANFLYYSSEADTLAALRAGKIDAFAAAEAVARYMMPENPDISILPEKLAGGMKVCSIFPKTEKGKALCDEFSTFIREIRDNGIYDEISRNYFETASEHRILPETEGLPAPNGTLRVAMNSTMAPFAYIQDGRTAGIDV